MKPSVELEAMIKFIDTLVEHTEADEEIRQKHKEVKENMRELGVLINESSNERAKRKKTGD